MKVELANAGITGVHGRSAKNSNNLERKIEGLAYAVLQLSNMRHVYPKRQKAGFTFLELVVGMAVLVLFAAVAFAALTQLNRFATASRLRVHALALAQQQIDEVLTVQWRVNGTRPPVLVTGTRLENNLTLNADAANDRADLTSLFTDLVTPVSANRVIRVTDLTSRTLRASVTVNYTYANRNYSVSLSTVRTTDTI